MTAVLRAGVEALKRGVAHITLVGSRAAVEACARQEGLSLEGLTLRDPATDPETAALAQRLVERRQHKGMTPEKAQTEIQKPLVFANMLVTEGKVDGSVSGAVHTTADVVRTAIQLIGPAPAASWSRASSWRRWTSRITRSRVASSTPTVAWSSTPRPKSWWTLPVPVPRARASCWARSRAWPCCRSPRPAAAAITRTC